MALFRSYPLKLKNVFLTSMTIAFLLSGIFVVFFFNYHMQSYEYSQIREISIVLSVILLLIMGMLFLFHLLMAQYLIFKPLDAIRSAAIAIADKKEAPGTQIPHPCWHEWQTVVSAFNQMSSTVGETIDGLNGAVADKTAELRETNRQLQEEIIEREETEAAYKEALKRFQLAIESGKIAVWEWSIQDNVLIWDERMFELYGIVPRKFSDTVQAWHQGLHPEDAPRAIEESYAAVRGEKKYDTEFRIMRPDGTVRHIKADAIMIRDDNGEAQKMIGLNRDITEQKRIERELRESRAILKAALDQSQAGIAIADAPDGRLRYVNRAGLMVRGAIDDPEAIEGVDADAYVPKWWICHLDGTPYEKEEVPLTRALLYGETCSREFLIKRPDGDDRIVIADAAPIRDDDGKITAAMVVFLDVTEQRRAQAEIIHIENQLRQAQKMETVGQLAGGVAHDFNNLLYVIMGYAELAAMQVAEDERLRKNIEAVISAADQAAALVRQLLLFSRKEAMQPKLLDMNRLVDGLMKMLNRVIGEQILLEFHPGSDLKRVHADPGQLEQVLMNLCVNARDAMPDGGRIVIEIENVAVDDEFCEKHPWSRPGEYVCLIVSDTGTGMTPEIQEKVFEPFFTTKEVGKGTGLGLSAVYGIVKAHSGMIHIYSEPDQGSVFRVYLPALAAAKEEDEIEKANPLEISEISGEKTILVVEDEQKVRELANIILTKAGYRVIQAPDGEAAIEIIEKRGDEIDLALLDVIMPKAGGHTVYEKIENLHPDMPVVFMTGYSRGLLPDIFTNHSYEILQKPFNRAQLLNKVQQNLALRNDIRE